MPDVEILRRAMSASVTGKHVAAARGEGGGSHVDALVGEAWGDGRGFLLGLAEKHGELLDGGHGDVTAVVSRKERLALEVEEEDGGRHGERLVAGPGRGLRSESGWGLRGSFEEGSRWTGGRRGRAPRGLAGSLASLKGWSSGRISWNLAERAWGSKRGSCAAEARAWSSLSSSAAVEDGFVFHRSQMRNGTATRSAGRRPQHEHRPRLVPLYSPDQTPDPKREKRAGPESSGHVAEFSI